MSMSWLLGGQIEDETKYSAILLLSSEKRAGAGMKLELLAQINKKSGGSG